MKTLLIAVLVLTPGVLFADCIKVGSCTKTSDSVITCTCNDPVTVVIDMNDLAYRLEVENNKLKDSQNNIQESNVNIDNINKKIQDLERQIEVARQLGTEIKG